MVAYKFNPKRQKCRHFNGLLNDTCRAGVNYRSLTTVGRLPCLGDKEPDEVECEKCDRFTEQEVKEQQKQMWESGAIAIQLIAKIQKEEGSSGSIECPKCSGSVNWTRASRNGHIHAECKTVGCVSVMQ